MGALLKLSPAEELRLALAWDLNVALRQQMTEVTRYGAASPDRDNAANAIYQTGIGCKPVEAAFAAATQAVAEAKTMGEIGQLFTAYVRAASEKHVEVVADAMEDPELYVRVSFEVTL